jgi:hypothetical protein
MLKASWFRILPATVVPSFNTTRTPRCSAHHFVVWRDDRPVHLFGRPGVADTGKIRTHTRSGLSEAVAVGALVGFVERLAARGVAAGHLRLLRERARGDRW